MSETVLIYIPEKQAKPAPVSRNQGVRTNNHASKNDVSYKVKKDVGVMIDVVCIGILVADVIAKPIDSIPAKGLLGLIDGISLHNGGAMSASIDMAKIGLNTAILGKVGNDSFGEYLKSALIENNINIDGLAVDNKYQTSASVVLSDSGGERTFLHCIGANGTFSKDDAPNASKSHLLPKI